jgi:hypothetical protein
MAKDGITNHLNITCVKKNKLFNLQINKSKFLILIHFNKS